MTIAGRKQSRELCELMEDIGRKLPLKFRHVRDAFRPLDLNHDGKITQSEMRSFLRGFGWSEDVADRLFLLLDEAGHGEVNYSDFMSHFEAVLGPANPPVERIQAVNVQDRRLEREINEVAALLGDRLRTKYKTAREAFRSLDLSNTGHITRSELRVFFRSLNMPIDAADQVFRVLARGADEIPYDEFVDLFGPEQPGGRWQSIEKLRDVPTTAIWRLF